MARYQVTTGAGLARLLLDRYGWACSRPARSASPPGRCGCGSPTGLLSGETEAERERALTAADPLALPWIAAVLARLEEILAALVPR